MSLKQFSRHRPIWIQYEQYLTGRGWEVAEPIVLWQLVNVIQDTSSLKGIWKKKKEMMMMMMTMKMVVLSKNRSRMESIVLESKADK